MRRNTIKWRIFKYNIFIIVVLIALTAIVFNITIKLYIESDIKKQLGTIASRAESTALKRGPDFFLPGEAKEPPPQPDMKKIIPHPQDKGDLFQFYLMLDRSLREPLTLLNADYILLDSRMNVVTSPEDGYIKPSEDILCNVTNEIIKIKDSKTQVYINFKLKGTEYIGVIKPVSNKNTFGLGWVIIYSSLQKVNQLQLEINIILFTILILSALIGGVFSSLLAKKISAPFSSLNRSIGEIAERNFGTKIQMPVYDELQEFVNNINSLSYKLDSYDKAQKTFLQNASHEFRTPLMCIQSYAEGIKHNVVDHTAASDVIIDETKRMTHLVEDLLYLSRLDAIEENYHFNHLYFKDLLNECIEPMKVIASKNSIEIISDDLAQRVEIYADEEKLSRAFANIISNCIRYARKTIKISSKVVDFGMIEISICDDGPGIDASELDNIFERFYKGKKGNFGLGLAISKNIIEKHNGKITAVSLETGALFKIVLPID